MVTTIILDSASHHPLPSIPLYNTHWLLRSPLLKRHFLISSGSRARVDDKSKPDEGEVEELSQLPAVILAGHSRPQRVLNSSVSHDHCQGALSEYCPTVTWRILA
ncbi:hypothetical protein CDEST_06496 [Colletotrichum destructivum]|uniref:Uncharacterized protein n=1 Tax=Colletotrichum destructivum TaxID=34406 RepID=A0AAX4IE18_9PEZI|nr:hypothetical protein CDEST_06496 [Colletotrichum destructivum]